MKEDSVEGRLRSPAISGTKQRCAGVKKKMWGVDKKHGAGEVAWAGGPGPGSTRGLKERHRGSKKKGSP